MCSIVQYFSHENILPPKSPFPSRTTVSYSHFFMLTLVKSMFSKFTLCVKVSIAQISNILSSVLKPPQPADVCKRRI